MSAFNLLDLPSGVFLYILDFLKGVHSIAPLRLVCRSFDTYVCEAMFDTLVFRGGPCRDPLKLYNATGSIYQTTQFVHQLDTLYTKKQHAALRRARRLGIFVSEVFVGPRSEILQDLRRREHQSAIHSLTTKLPSIIRTLENLEAATMYLSQFDNDEFTLEMSNALLTLPHLSTLTIIFLDQQISRSLLIVGSPRLVTIKISWPLASADPISPSTPEGSSIYAQMFGAAAHNTGLKCLELRSADELRPKAELYQFEVFPCLEELVIDNVPVMISGNIVKQMGRLHSLRLAYGGFISPDREPCSDVWANLTEVGRQLKRLSVDMVGEALLAYLCSYDGLEALELTLRVHAETVHVQDLFLRCLRYHEESCKSLRFYVQPPLNPLSTWLFEYWKEWIPPFRHLERLEVTTSLNLFSEHDAWLLVKNITDVVVLIPTLQMMTIHHQDEGFAPGHMVERFVQNLVQPTGLNRPYTTVPQCIVVIHNLPRTFRFTLDRSEGRYDSLKLTCSHLD